jgi:hypothetical protein
MLKYCDLSLFVNGQVRRYSVPAPAGAGLCRDQQAHYRYSLPSTAFRIIMMIALTLGAPFFVAFGALSGAAEPVNGRR